MERGDGSFKEEGFFVFLEGVGSSILSVYGFFCEPERRFPCNKILFKEA